MRLSGAAVGSSVGDNVGCALVGVPVGALNGDPVGRFDGPWVGPGVGVEDCGPIVGISVGDDVGDALDGAAVGALDGDPVGVLDGPRVGGWVGTLLGTGVGGIDGAMVGLNTHSRNPRAHARGFDVLYPSQTRVSSLMQYAPRGLPRQSNGRHRNGSSASVVGDLVVGRKPGHPVPARISSCEVTLPSSHCPEKPFHPKLAHPGVTGPQRPPHVISSHTEVGRNVGD